MTADTPDPRPDYQPERYDGSGNLRWDYQPERYADPRPVSPPSELTAALLRIFDLAENRPDIRAVVTAALDTARTAPQPDEGLRVYGLTVEEIGRAIATANMYHPQWRAAAPVPAGLDVERLADALALHQRKDGLIQPPLVAEGNGYRMATPTEFARALSQLPEDAP